MKTSPSDPQTTNKPWQEKAETLHGELFGFEYNLPSRADEIELIRKYLADAFEIGQEFVNDKR